MKVTPATQRSLVHLVLIVAVFCVILAMTLLLSLLAVPEAGEVARGPSTPTALVAMLPRAGATPQPTLGPTRQPALEALGLPTPEPTAGSLLAATPAVAIIELEVRFATGGASVDSGQLWTVVQWQDGLGMWHEVEGWQGRLEGGSRKAWAVVEKDFGTGPFRWLIRSDCACGAVAVSDPFRLPLRPGEVLRVRVTIGP